METCKLLVAERSSHWLMGVVPLTGRLRGFCLSLMDRWCNSFISCVESMRSEVVWCSTSVAADQWERLSAGQTGAVDQDPTGPNGRTGGPSKRLR